MTTLSVALVSETLQESGGLVQLPPATAARDFTAVTTDSRAVKQGTLFIAYKGITFDGHTAIDAAVKAGATGVVLTDEKFVAAAGGVPVWVVKDGRQAWTWLTAAYFNHPERVLRFVGVTGTNGKSSTTWMIRELLRENGETALLIGTMGAWLGDEFFPTQHTTPDPPALFDLLQKAASRGVRYVVMEVSSHALVQEKLGPIRFAAATFTSFSRDHLDFHRDMGDYFQAKMRLFSERLHADGLALFCHDIRMAGGEVQCTASTQVWYGDRQQCAKNTTAKAVSFQSLRSAYTGSTLQVWQEGERREGTIGFFGLHALKNFVAALATVEFLMRKKMPPEIWKRVRPVPGRLEPAVPHAKSGPYVFVDYAHTPDALEKTLQVLRPLCPGALWVVFGCGGDRDRGKRPLMGRIAATLADHAIVTSDNPRTEDPHAILEEIVQGMPAAPAHVEVDRRQAIVWAVQHAAVDDCIVIAGKGHEDYQIIGQTKLPFDDRIIAREALASRKKTSSGTP